MDKGTANTIRRLLVNARAAAPIDARGLAQDPKNPARNKVVDSAAWDAACDAMAKAATAAIVLAGYSRELTVAVGGGSDIGERKLIVLESGTPTGIEMVIQMPDDRNSYQRMLERDTTIRMSPGGDLYQKPRAGKFLQWFDLQLAIHAGMVEGQWCSHCKVS